MKNGDFPRPSVTVDLVLMTVKDSALSVLLQKRADPPYQGCWALPGGFVGIDESLDQSAARILSVKAGLKDAYMEQLYSFGAIDRDPRERVITIAYFALLPQNQFESALSSRQDLLLATLDAPQRDDAEGTVRAFAENEKAVSLAFDHADILGHAIGRLRGKLDYAPIAFALLPRLFTLRALQQVHEAILSKPLNKPAFRRRILDKGWIEPSGERESGSAFRPAELFRLKRGVLAPRS